MRGETPNGNSDVSGDSRLPIHTIVSAVKFLLALPLLSYLGILQSFNLQAQTSPTFEKEYIYVGGKLLAIEESFICTGGTTPVAPAPSSLPADTVWWDDQVPGGAALWGTWIWDTNEKASGTQS